ncbi:cytochrome b561 [Tatumella sp. UBA2305]|uniref:cytochrome b561 n=1 Tax=Tatumella sp. UBA2305 TaxID=1947647 RepID=UPI0025CDC317|nr:cytochrome b561 [Tatumella sp. UBA2305]
MPAFPNKYQLWQIRLHWLTLLLLIIVYSTIELRGFAIRGSWQGKAIIMTHFSCGVLVFAVMCARLLLRYRYPAPPVTPPLKRWQQLLSSLAHKLLYLLFLILPVLGVCSRYVRGQQWLVFGVAMPVSDHPDYTLSRQIIHWHETLANAGYWLIGVHALAALAHHFLFRDDTLLRMVPARRHSPRQ